MTEMIRGDRTVIWVFTSDVGSGSKAQVVDFIFLMMFCTSSDETIGKQLRGWEKANDRGAVWVRGPGSAERMSEILVVKKSIKRLHCSAEDTIGEGICSFRRWFTVEKSCLDFPGLFLMVFEKNFDLASFKAFEYLF
ncbi:hypothetical protein MHYP_G00320930 [Metynnis hypsauchen]